MDMMMSARHKSYANAVKYKKDADAIMHMAAAAGEDLAKVAFTWKSVYLADVQCISTPTKDDMSLDQELQKNCQDLPQREGPDSRALQPNIMQWRGCLWNEFYYNNASRRMFEIETSNGAKCCKFPSTQESPAARHCPSHKVRCRRHMPSMRRVKENKKKSQ